MIVIGLLCLKISGGQQFSNIIAIALKWQQLITFHKNTILTSLPALACGHAEKTTYLAFNSLLFDDILPIHPLFFS